MRRGEASLIVGGECSFVERSFGSFRRKDGGELHGLVFKVDGFGGSSLGRFLDEDLLELFDHFLGGAADGFGGEDGEFSLGEARLEDFLVGAGGGDGVSEWGDRLDEGKTGFFTFWRRCSRRRRFF